MKDDARREIMGYLQTVTTVAVIIFALLLVSIERPMRVAGSAVLPVALGIAGLLFVAAALNAMRGFREAWRARGTSADGGDEQGEFVPLLFEIGLWALAALYVVRLVEIARG